MPLRYKELKGKGYEILDLTSLTEEEFEIINVPFEQKFQEYMAEWRMDGQPRTGRRYTTYKNCPLPSSEDRLLFVLIYMKNQSLQILQGRLFGMRQCKANIWIHLLLTVLRESLVALGDAPSRNIADLAKRLAIPVAEASQLLAEGEAEPSADAADSSEAAALFCHDGTERTIGRPLDPIEQKSTFSGKKRRNTIKNLLLINAVLTILFLSPTEDGHVHDKRMADAHPYPLPEGSQLLQDLGFLAFAIDGVEIIMPNKKPKGQELTPEQKAENQRIASRRIRIEHVNSSVKRCRIVKDVCRLLKRSTRDLVMEIACALHNFRIRLQPWQPMT